MEIEKLFKGIAVVIDDQVNEEDSSISKIVKFLKEKNLPVVTYDEIPDEDVIDSLQDASFIILDWEYNKIGDLVLQGDERLALPSELEGDSKKELLNFIKQIMDKIFVPVFIFTDQEPNSIEDILKAKELYICEKPNRIFIKRKSELSNYDALIKAIESWVQQMPSVYVLKKWEEALNLTKNKMFIEMYEYSSSWVNILRDLLKKDSSEYKQEFGEFLTKNITNRIGTIDFNDAYFGGADDITPDELSRVMEGERYLKYREGNSPMIAYTGDLFKESGKYYLNIRAQCDLAREEDPILYFISGKKLPVKNIVTGEVSINEEGVLQINDNQYNVGELQELISDEEGRGKLNSDFKKIVKGNIFSKGAVIEKANEVIIACIDGQKAIKFDIKLCARKFGEVKNCRIGRVLPPHITRIQQKCAQHIIREGTIPLPKDIFN